MGGGWGDMGRTEGRKVGRRRRAEESAKAMTGCAPALSHRAPETEGKLRPTNLVISDY